MKARFSNALTAAIASSLVLVFTHHAQADDATWTGLGSGGNWATEGNWDATPVPGAGNTATFDNAGNGKISITVGTITLGTVAFDTASAAAYTLSGGTITFADGNSTGVSISSSVTANEVINANLTLGTAVASNTIFSNQSTSSLLTLGGNIAGGTGGTADSKTLTINGAGATKIDGVISNGGATALALTKNGEGTLTLTGTNTYTGATTINGGTLDLGGSTATGSLDSTVLNLGGGTLSYTRTGSATQTFTTTNINVGASGATTVVGNTLKLGDIVRSTGGTLNVGNVGAITTTETNVLGILGGWATYNNENWAVANGDASAITALGTYTAGNNTATTYTNANINVATAEVVGTINANSLRFSGAGTKTLTLATGDNIIQSGGILVTSSVGDNLSTITGGDLLGSASGDLIVHQHNTSNSLTIGSVIKNNGGATGLTKVGAGTLTLSNANTYTGATNVNGGKLVVTESLGSSAVTVQNAGTILATDAVASFGSTLTIKDGAILAIGDAGSAGTATVSSGITFESGSIFSWDLNTAGADNSANASNQGTFDKVIGTATGTGIFQVVLAGAYSDPFWATNKTWTDIFSAGAETFTQFAGDFVSSSGYVAGFGSFTYTGGTLSWTAIPEPTGALAGLLLGAGLLRRRRSLTLPA